MRELVFSMRKSPMPDLDKEMLFHIVEFRACFRLNAFIKFIWNLEKLQAQQN